MLSHARVEPIKAPPAHIDAPTTFESQPVEIDVEIVTEIDAEIMGAGVPVNDIVQLPTGDILVRRDWSFNGTQHHGPDLTCFRILWKSSHMMDEPKEGPKRSPGESIFGARPKGATVSIFRMAISPAPAPASPAQINFNFKINF